MQCQSSFEQIALPYMTALHQYALRLTMNSEDAKDLLQETYVKAFRFWDRFEQGTNIKAWLHRIMKNSYINCYRRKIKEPLKISYEEHHLPYNTTPETLLFHKPVPKKPYNEIFSDEIADSIGSLNEIFKNTLVLSDVEDLSYEEIAKIVGCPVGTVRSRLHRARKILKKKLFVYARENGYIRKTASA